MVCLARWGNWKQQVKNSRQPRIIGPCDRAHAARDQEADAHGCAYLRAQACPGAASKLFETFGPLGAQLPCFFSADVALANAPAAPSSPPFVRRDGLMKGGVVGAMMLFDLIWLVHGGFWMKK